MESDDDYSSFSPHDEPSPPVHNRKLKRLKKASNAAKEPPVKSISELLSLPPVDFAALEALESSKTKTLGSEDDLTEQSQSQSLSDGFDSDKELNSSGFDEERKETKRALEFDDVADDFDGRTRLDRDSEMEEIMDLNTEKLIDDMADESAERKGEMEEEMADSNAEKLEKKKRACDGELDDKKAAKKKNKRAKSGIEVKPSDKRKELKERKAHLEQLHAESQRLLRETREAAFKPMPVMQKPISSVLEKIRQRKLELSKKSFISKNSVSVAAKSSSLREVMMDDYSDDLSIEERGVDKLENVVEEETVVCQEDGGSSLNASRMILVNEYGTQSSQGKVLDEESTPAFRAPVDDTQDLFNDSETSDTKDKLPSEQQNGLMEETLAPSLLAMNLKFDSAPPDDFSSDEEENDKETIDPRPSKLDDGCSSPIGDPVKAFVDDEAVEEDDSDHDLHRFQENDEDEDDEDIEELRDMIVTGYKEKPSDNERRNELHQKWLEQQDAAGTDNLLQRLKYGSKLQDRTLLDEEEEDDEDEEELSAEAEEDLVPAKLARINSRKAKEMITQMFHEKDDAFLSSDDEETEKRLVKQRLLDKAGEEATLLPPAEDESSREVFGLIKKLNIAPVTKKKAKASCKLYYRTGFINFIQLHSLIRCYQEEIATALPGMALHLSSFLGRVSNNSLPPSNKQGSSRVRSYIFGRDDSNSRSSISIAEDSSDAIPKGSRPTRNVTTKFSSSQAKSSTQVARVVPETAPGTSLFEVLKRSSVQSNTCNPDTTVDLTQSVFAAFKIPKEPIKIEGTT
ncbi:hypothetical protein RJ639_029585 [Escallonia herrerae]|uniref:Uncharacterized protein n=1 Tax=Escallonia herrerae TaxID=1293975 RepID=A0AA89BNK4_9ASTE|nr:hypothetical protein RJ639_029585 [Escallonia herrerae]